jgi:hypothetical protein
VVLETLACLWLTGGGEPGKNAWYLAVVIVSASLRVGAVDKNGSHPRVTDCTNWRWSVMLLIAVTGALIIHCEVRDELLPGKLLPVIQVRMDDVIFIRDVR